MAALPARVVPRGGGDARFEERHRRVVRGEAADREETARHPDRKVKESVASLVRYI